MKYLILLYNFLLTNLSREQIRSEKIEPVVELHLKSFNKVFDNSYVEQILTDNGKAESNRSLNCLPLIKLFQIRLKLPLEMGEGVGLTGDHKLLGNWVVDKSLEMKRERKSRLHWYIKLPICATLRMYFRYFIYYKDGRGRKCIKRWEAQQHARILETYEWIRAQSSLTYGEAYPIAVGGSLQNERGWLRYEYIIQLKFVWFQHIQFTYFPYFLRKPVYNIKLLIDNANHYKDTYVEVVQFDHGYTEFKVQNDNGAFYKPGSIVIFHISIAIEQKPNYWLLITHRLTNDFLGKIFIAYDAFDDKSEGVLYLPILNYLNVEIGWLTLPYLIVQPLPTALQLNFRTSFHHYWPLNWPLIDIAVMTSTYYKNAQQIIDCGTIEGLLKTYNRFKYDMIKISVQLTKDLIPIIWPESGFYTVSPLSNVNLKPDLTYIYICDFTYEELKSKRIILQLERNIIELTHLNGKHVDIRRRLLPTLRTIFKYLPLTLGIIIDMEWPQLRSNGWLDYMPLFDKNHYVNAVLMISHNYGCGRPMIFISSDPDICVMLRLKQHIVPVIYETISNNHNNNHSLDSIPPYADLRTQSSTNAIKFVQSAEILGIALHLYDFLNELNTKNTLQWMDNYFQVIFLLAINEKILHSTTESYLKEFESIPISGVIYNPYRIPSAISKLIKHPKHLQLFEAKELQQIFRRQCTAAGNLSFVEFEPDTRSPFWPRL